MDVAVLRRSVFACCVGVAVSAGGTALAQAPAALPGYNAAIGETSVSGVSSGAYMASQFGTAWSSLVKGVGLVAGGPYWCAKADGYFTYWSAISNATGVCLSGPLSDPRSYSAKADAKAASGAIDPLKFLSRQKIYLFHGYNDAVLARRVTDAAAEFYRRYLGEANRGNLYYQTALGAGHALVVAHDPPVGGLNDCKANRSPFIDQCGYDQAGIILQHIYGALNDPRRGPLTGTIKPFDQSIYTKPNGVGSLSLGKTGYVFVPKECEQGEACRVHVALHGCRQDSGEIDRRFIDHAGYNAWADTNRLIVLYPQTAASSWYPYNPNACWDWWGYVDYDDSYVTKSGPQIKAIKAMLDALTARATPAASRPAPAAMPFLLKVIDRSDTAVDLAWVPQADVTSYRVFRSGADGAFAAVADVPGPSFADIGLTPKTAYRWRVAALANGVEGPVSNEAATITRPPPAPCANPGACPIGE